MFDPLTDDDDDTLITNAELRRMVPISDAHIRRLEKAGSFPSRIHLTPRRIAWYRKDIKAWVQDRSKR